MRREDLNIFANAILDVLPPEGTPESYLCVAAEEANCIPGSVAVNLLIQLGLLRRDPGNIIKRGPKWDEVIKARKRFYESRGLDERMARCLSQAIKEAIPDGKEEKKRGGRNI
jgi:hypothetical protein